MAAARLALAVALLQPSPGASAGFWKAVRHAVGPLGLETRHVADPVPVLPAGLSFATVELAQRSGGARELARFLSEHYQGDDAFAVRQPSARLRWVLRAPAMRADWALCVRDQRSGGRLVGFVAAVPRALWLDGAQVDGVEVCFLCVHPGYRGRGLTPLLLRELARRLARHGVRVAVYTGSKRLPGALAEARYYHRPLQPLRLARSGFVEVEPAFVHLYALHFRLPRRTATAGLRPMRKADIAQCARLLDSAHARARLGLRYRSPAELAHWLRPRAREQMAAYVVDERATGAVRAVVAFSLSTAVRTCAAANATPSDRTRAPWWARPVSAVRGLWPRASVRGAVLHVLAADASVDVAELLRDASVLARRRGCHVLSALESHTTPRAALGAAKFREGDNSLHFYLYNYGLAAVRAAIRGRGGGGPVMPAGSVALMPV